MKYPLARIPKFLVPGFARANSYEEACEKAEKIGRANIIFKKGRDFIVSCVDEKMLPKTK